MQPRVTDNDKGEITVSLNGKEIRGWSYASDAERRTKMLCALEYVEGWRERQSRLKAQIDTRLNDCLCEMKEGYDDSIVGFNEAWDIVRKVFDESAARSPQDEAGKAAEGADDKVCRVRAMGWRLVDCIRGAQSQEKSG
jgi:hypothetical protein